MDLDRSQHERRKLAEQQRISKVALVHSMTTMMDAAGTLASTFQSVITSLLTQDTLRSGKRERERLKVLKVEQKWTDLISYLTNPLLEMISAWQSLTVSPLRLNSSPLTQRFPEGKKKQRKPPNVRHKNIPSQIGVILSKS